MRVEWTEPALTENAYRFIERLFDAAAQLTDFPERGRYVPKAERGDVRELLYKDYRIIYRTKPEQVDILTVLHGSRDLKRKKNKAMECQIEEPVSLEFVIQLLGRRVAQS